MRQPQDRPSKGAGANGGGNEGKRRGSNVCVRCGGHVRSVWLRLFCLLFLLLLPREASRVIAAWAWSMGRAVFG